MSGDLPTKSAASGPLDSIILGDDEELLSAIAEPPKDVPVVRASARPTQQLPTSDAQSPIGGIPIINVGAALVRPEEEEEEEEERVVMSTPRVVSPDDTLELSPRDPRERQHSQIPQAPGIDGSTEAGWTPFSPEVAGADAELDPHASGPASEEIPIALDLTGEIDDDDRQLTNPRLPVTFDLEESRIDEVERYIDPDAPEVDAEDLVSVESIPAHIAAKAQTAAALMSATDEPITPRVAPAPKEQPAPVMARPEPRELVFVPPAGQLAPPPMSEHAASSRKKVRPWWEELFNDDYIRTMAKVTDAQIGSEATFIEESLGCEAGAMILDLACGTGRHAVELASRGYQVVGFDLSLSMLARASDEAQERGEKINFVQGDMREMTFEDTFDGVYAWNTSFGFFDEEKNAAVVARVHKSLKKGGQFLLDVINRDYVVRQAPSLAWFEGDGCICMDEMQIDFITSRMKTKRTLMMDDGRTKEIEYSIRVYSLHELGKLLHDNGFRVAEVSGRTGTPGVFFGCESPRTLILAEKR